MTISNLKSLSNPADMFLSPVLLGLAVAIVGVILASPQLPQTSQQQSANNTDSGPGLNTGINDPEFNKALPHILKWEGKCSDHWADNGGRTYKGITWEVARKHGFKGDVCTMSDQQVYQIYYNDYWSKVPKHLDYPRKLAYFNMRVNGTNSTCLNKPTAEEMLNCQGERYKRLRDAPHFLKGWLNRNNDLLDAVKKVK